MTTETIIHFIGFLFISISILSYVILPHYIQSRIPRNHSFNDKILKSRFLRRLKKKLYREIKNGIWKNDGFPILIKLDRPLLLKDNEKEIIHKIMADLQYKYHITHEDLTCPCIVIKDNRTWKYEYEMKND